MLIDNIMHWFSKGVVVETAVLCQGFMRIAEQSKDGGITRMVHTESAGLPIVSAAVRRYSDGDQNVRCPYSDDGHTCTKGIEVAESHSHSLKGGREILESPIDNPCFYLG